MQSIESIHYSNTPYDTFPFLEQYREFFGDLKNTDIIGEWNFGIVIGWPGWELVYKIGKTNEFSEELKIEYDNHITFYKGVERLWKDGNIRVPMVSMEPRTLTNNGTELTIYEMERIHGISILRYDLIKHYSKEFVWMESSSDMDIIEHLHKKWILSMEEYLMFYSNGIRIVWENFPELAQELTELLEKLKQEWIEHLDLHAGNILIKNHNHQLQMYFIDFGKAKTS